MTIRIQLIVTGRLEELALHDSLQNLFANEDVEFLAPQKSQDFTSNRLGPYPAGSQRRPLALKLASALVSAVHPGRHGGDPAELTIAVDDLELANQDQAAHVVDYFARAVREHVESFWPSDAARQRVYGELARRASFHLLAPMVETYFFGEPASLVRAKANRAANLFDAARRDVEDFEVMDPAYLAKAPTGTPWNVQRHPKHYIRYLCDPTGTVDRPYRETTEGIEALKTLAWNQVLGTSHFTRFARSLFMDVADALGLAPTAFPGQPEPLTQRRSGGLLRNIAHPE